MYFNNITNQLVQSSQFYPVVRRYGHVFLSWCTSAYTIATESFNQNPCFLTDIELCRLHRQFGHPSVPHLQQILERSGQDFELHAIEHLTKYCYHC